MIVNQQRTFLMFIGGCLIVWLIVTGRLEGTVNILTGKKDVVRTNPNGSTTQTSTPAPSAPHVANL